MKISLSNWSYKNIRGGLSDIEIDLGNPPAQYGLIQMPNGTGKTTTMKLFRALFTEQKLTPDEIDNFKASPETEAGEFTLGLEIDGKPYRLRMEFDFAKCTVTYWTTRSAKYGGGEEPGIVLPNELKMLLTARFSRLFIFDGELAKSIRERGGSEADEAIKTLYRLNELNVLRSRVAQILEKEQSAARSVTSAKRPQGVNQLLTQRNSAHTLLKRLLVELDKKQTKLEEFKSEIDAVNLNINEFISRNGDLKSEDERLTERENKQNKSLLEKVELALSDYRSPARISTEFHSRMAQLGEKFATLKLPKTISRDFFKDLSEEKYCVCGRKIGPDHKSEIVRRSQSYLAEDQIQIIVGMRRTLDDVSSYTSTFPVSVKEVISAQRNCKELERERDVLMSKVLADGDDQLSKLNIRKGELEALIPGLEKAIEHLNTKDPQRQRAIGCNKKSNITLARREYEKKKTAYEKATETEDFTAKSEALMAHLRRIESYMLRELREDIRVATNAKLQSLVLMHHLEVSHIDGALHLASDRFDQHNDVSEGQSLSVAYAFLTSLLAAATIELPFIVDSPAVSLDLDVRREVVSMIPDLFDQMIMFVLSSEQAGFSEGFFGKTDTKFINLSLEENGQVKIQEGVHAFTLAAQVSENNDGV